ncbi:hypothetical protein V3W47_18235 [Deinococcus sp. YIM 134068]|uniref:hypothetical protein n=1 Tax=Deinococcus lichenicola TaxID=3118910 RepID=UPI002F92BBA5
MPTREVFWDGDKNKVIVSTLKDLMAELRKATEEAVSIQIQVDFVLSIDDRAFLLTVGEGNRSHVMFARGTPKKGNQRFDYVLDGIEEEPFHVFLYGGSCSEVAFNRTASYEAAVDALKEFFANGDRPGSLSWETPS